MTNETETTKPESRQDKWLRLNGLKRKNVPLRLTSIDNIEHLRDLMTPAGATKRVSDGEAVSNAIDETLARLTGGATDDDARSRRTEEIAASLGEDDPYDNPPLRSEDIVVPDLVGGELANLAARFGKEPVAFVEWMLGFFRDVNPNDTGIAPVLIAGEAARSIHRAVKLARVLNTRNAPSEPAAFVQNRMNGYVDGAIAKAISSEVIYKDSTPEMLDGDEDPNWFIEA
jgi:hypothetical protein